MDEKIKKELLRYQKNEIVENSVYRKLANSVVNERNKKILYEISRDEIKHYNLLKKYTLASPKPNRFLIFYYYLVSKIFGLTFGLKLMEKGEARAKINYKKFYKEVPEAKEILKDENRHEIKLIGLLDEEKLKYISSIVLGLNDALVELTGALAGYTLALRDPKIIATAGFVTGIAASLSMAASEYLSTKSEKNKNKSSWKASVYTGIAYLFTVVFLIFPYLILKDPYISLIWTLFNAVFVILVFTFYTSVANDVGFKKSFSEMVIISLGVALFSFIIGYFVRIMFGIEV